MYGPGDRVVVKRKKDRCWYPATFAGITNGACSVKYDDGSVGLEKESDIAPLTLGAGDRVWCRWKSGNVYYPGKVDRVDGERVYIKYDDGDEEWSSLPFLKVHRSSVKTKEGLKLEGWWSQVLDRDFILPQVEIVSYLGLFLLFLFASSRSGGGDVSRLPADLFSFDVLRRLAGNYYLGIMSVAAMFIIFFSLTFYKSLNRFRFYILKVFLINIALGFIVTNFIVLSGLLEPARLNGIMFFSMYWSLFPPIAIAVYYDLKREKGFLREFLVFSAMILLATVPQLIRMRFSANSIVYYFMELAVLYFASFFIFIPWEWSKGTSTGWDKFIKIILLNTGIILIPITYIFVYAVIGAVGEGIFGRGTVPNTLFSGGGGGMFGPLEVAPITVIYFFIMDYLRAFTVLDLLEGVLLFWGISSMTMNMSNKARLFYDGGYVYSKKKIELLAGIVLVVLFFSQPFWR